MLYREIFSASSETPQKYIAVVSGQEVKFVIVVRNYWA